MKTFARATIGLAFAVLACGPAEDPQGQTTADDDGSAGPDGDDDGDGDGDGDDDGTPTSGPTSGADDGDDVDPTTPADDEGSGSGDETGGLPADAEIWELRADGFSPPEIETYYSCFSFNIPVDQLHHVIGFRPQVTNPVIHHYVLSFSPNPVELDPLVPCIDWPSQILWAWAPGITEMLLPEEAGFLVGHTGDMATFIIQVHYNNPLMQTIEDHDGIDVIVTKKLREFRAGVFSQGDIGSIDIPGGQAAYEHVATCSEEETTGLLTEPMHVFSSFLHAHKLGAAITSDIVRGDEVISIAEDVPFDFNQQEFQPTDVDLMPGDRVETRCVYDSSKLDSSTPGGIASDEEMCINFMMYYPWVPAETCGSL